MALQADPAALRIGAQHFSAASNAMEASLNSMYGRVLALVEGGQSGWVGDGATAFLSRLNTEVSHYRNGIQALRQIPPILLYLAAEMEEIIALRRQADELEAEAQNASPIEAAWLLARAAALRAEAEAKAEFADFKGAAEFLAVDVRQMATDFWDSAPMIFTRHEIVEGVTWMKQEFRAEESELLSIGESIWQDPRSFAAGLLTSVGKEISFGTLPLNEPDEPDAAYYAGRALGDITGVVGGTIMTGIGGAVEGGGFVLDGTGIGAVIGVPANVAGAAIIAGGASLGAISSANFANDTNQMFAKVQEGADSGSGGNEGMKSAAAGTGELSATEQSVQSKLDQYLLNPDYPVGGSKANWFQKALGFNRDNMGELAKQIKFDPNTAVETGVTQYGTKYNQVINIVGANGRRIDVTFAWIRNNDGIVRLVTAIPTGK